MSWLSISLPNPFKSLQFPEDEYRNLSEVHLLDNQFAAGGGTGGVKDDLLVIGKTISRQLSGVAAFLAPPPATPAEFSPDDGDIEVGEAEVGEDCGDSTSETLAGIRSDLAELGGSFKSSLSGLSRFAANFLQLSEVGAGNDSDSDDGDEDEKRGVNGVAITDEIVEFVKEISMRPECWTDFPLQLNHDFSMSRAQAEHVSGIDKLVPSLAALEDSLSADMSDERFWMIYFILLLPRLDEHDSELLSTPEIVEARNELLQMLESNRNELMQMLENNRNGSEKSQALQSDSDDNEAETVINTDEKNVVLPERPEASKVIENKEHDIVQRRSEEEDANSGSVRRNGNFKNEEDVSFSDLEDDDSDFASRHSAQVSEAPSRVGSSEWVRLNRNTEVGSDHLREGQLKLRNRDSEDDETNDWLTIDDFDSDSTAAA